MTVNEVVFNQMIYTLIVKLIHSFINTVERAWLIIMQYFIVPKMESEPIGISNRTIKLNNMLGYLLLKVCPEYIKA